MEIETLFTDQKWQILSLLTKNTYSPLQLAELTKTTISNISQQLKLLEAYHLVKRTKISNRDKGKPRVAYSLTDDYAYLISIAKDFASKKLLRLDDYHIAILKIWNIERTELHPILTEAYTLLRQRLPHFSSITLLEEGEIVRLHIIHDGSTLAEKAISGAKDICEGYEKIIKITSTKSAGKSGSDKDTVVLFDRADMLKKGPVVENSSNTAVSTG